MYCKLASLVCNVSTILERCNWGNSDDETRHQRTEVWEIILYSLPPEVENESFKFSSKAWTPFISMYKWCYFSASEPADANLLQIHPLERKSHVDDPDNIWSCREFLVYHLACMPKYVCPTNVALLDWVRCRHFAVSFWTWAEATIILVVLEHLLLAQCKIMDLFCNQSIVLQIDTIWYSYVVIEAKATMKLDWKKDQARQVQF